MVAAPNVRRNIVSNFLGNIWTGAMGLTFIPLYIKFLGIGSYGLIGAYTSIRVVLAVLDMGISTTLNRELARLSVVNSASQEARDLLRTFEILYWGAGVLVGTGLAASAPLIARHWFKTQGVPVKTVEQALMIMGLVLAVEWPLALYFGGLMGLQRQVLLNEVRAGAATVRGGGAVLVLWLISPTIQAYFSWQIIVTAAQTAVMAACLWKSLPQTKQPATFRKELWMTKQGFAGGVAGITLLATILTQLDKAVLSKALALEMFGYYAFAATVAGALSYLATPIFSALFPRLSQQVERGKQADLAQLYHKSCQLMSVAVLPLAILVALFSKQLLSLWVSDPVTVKNTHLLVSLLIAGTSLNSIMLVPLALQFAHGWTRLSLYKNVVSVALFIPLLVWLVVHYGSTGAAIAWIALNAGYFLFEVPIMHRRLLKDEMWRWYGYDIGIPSLIALSSGLVSRILMPEGATVSVRLVWLGLTGLLALFFAALATSSTRKLLLELSAL